MPAGEVSSLKGPLGLHSLQNNTSEKAISIHIYSPPCLEFGDAECGSGPLIYCNRMMNNMSEEELLRLYLESQTTVYGNFRQLTKLLKREIDPNPQRPLANIEHVKKLLSSFELHPDELANYLNWDSSSYCRNLVAYDEAFTILLLTWDKGQVSPIHDHAGSSCWVKVISGELNEVLYTYPRA
jgi:predicted metal-dependent enzyme (double-stranded beta helix superfamily)